MGEKHKAQSDPTLVLSNQFFLIVEISIKFTILTYFQVHRWVQPSPRSISRIYHQTETWYSLNTNSSFFLPQGLVGTHILCRWIWLSEGPHEDSQSLCLFCDGLTSLGINSSRFSYTAACVRFSFLLKILHCGTHLNFLSFYLSVYLSMTMLLRRV